MCLFFFLIIFQLKNIAKDPERAEQFAADAFEKITILEEAAGKKADGENIAEVNITEVKKFVKETVQALDSLVGDAFKATKDAATNEKIAKVRYRLLV